MVHATGLAVAGELLATVLARKSEFDGADAATIKAISVSNDNTRNGDFDVVSESVAAGTSAAAKEQYLLSGGIRRLVPDSETLAALQQPQQQWLPPSQTGEFKLRHVVVERSVLDDMPMITTPLPSRRNGTLLAESNAKNTIWVLENGKKTRIRSEDEISLFFKSRPLLTRGTTLVSNELDVLEIP